MFSCRYYRFLQEEQTRTILEMNEQEFMTNSFLIYLVKDRCHNVKWESEELKMKEEHPKTSQGLEFCT